MAEHDEVSDAHPSRPKESLSKTPSWIMLGFILGVIFVISLPPFRRPPEPPPVPPVLSEVPPEPAAPREPPALTTIEAVFAEWQQQAVWSGDTTEVALWNIRDKAFSEFYEVRRLGDALYFRTISKLTRRIITRGKPQPSCPLQFTETEEQYQEWLQYGRRELSTSLDLRPRPAPAPTPRPLDVAPVPATPPARGPLAPKIEVPTTPPNVIK